jgi:hypothetical protein
LKYFQNFPSDSLFDLCFIYNALLIFQIVGDFLVGVLLLIVGLISLQ